MQLNHPLRVVAVQMNKLLTLKMWVLYDRLPWRGMNRQSSCSYLLGPINTVSAYPCNHEQSNLYLTLLSSIQAINQHGDSPLDWAYRNSHHNIVSCLLNTSIKFNDINEIMNTTTNYDSVVDGEDKKSFHENPSHTKIKKVSRGFKHVLSSICSKSFLLQGQEASSR